MDPATLMFLGQTVPNHMAGTAAKAAGGSMLSGIGSALAHPALIPASLGVGLLSDRRDKRKAKKEQKEAQEQAQMMAQLEAFAQNINMLGQFFNQQNQGRHQAIQGALGRGMR